jgi:hypothetical protein
VVLRKLEKMPAFHDETTGKDESEKYPKVCDGDVDSYQPSSDHMEGAGIVDVNENVELVVAYELGKNNVQELVQANGETHCCTYNLASPLGGKLMYVEVGKVEVREWKMLLSKERGDQVKIETVLDLIALDRSHFLLKCNLALLAYEHSWDPNLAEFHSVHVDHLQMDT